MKTEEMVIVAADFVPKDYGGVSNAVNAYYRFINSMMGTGACIKLNSILRYLGQSEIQRLHSLGFKVMADYKLFEIPNTTDTDGQFLAECSPEILTVMCATDVAAIKRLVVTIPSTTVAGVTILTSMDDERCREVYKRNTALQGVLDFSQIGFEGGLRALVCSPLEASAVKKIFNGEVICITPAIRPKWSFVEGDDQSRSATPKQAIEAGADIIVVGRPIMRAPSSKEAYFKTVEEVEGVLK